jgi:hypothetical protein
MLQRRTETWDIRSWTKKQIKDKINGFFRRKKIEIEEIHIVPSLLEIKYYDMSDEENKVNGQLNPSKRSRL